MATNQQSQITPPPELSQKCWDKLRDETQILDATKAWDKAIALAYQAGADQRGAANEAELHKARDEEREAIIHWLITGPYGFSIAANHDTLINDLRIARRPKPPSQAEAGLEELKVLRGNLKEWGLGFNGATIQTALERLKELEALPDDN